MAATMLLLTTFASCKKGDTGAAGVDGNANVHGTTGTIFTSNWLWNAAAQVNYVDFTDNDITESIVDNGTVSVFISTDIYTINPIWIALPYTVWANPSFNYGFNYTYEKLEVTLSTTSHASVTPSGTIYVKIVAIAASTIRKHPHTDWNNYEQIKATLGNELIETTATLKH